MRNRLLEIFGCRKMEHCLKQVKQILLFSNKTEHEIVDITAQLQTNFATLLLLNVRGSKCRNFTSKLEL